MVQSNPNQGNRPFPRLSFAPVSQLVCVQNHSYENVFPLRVHFYANQTYFHVKGLARRLFWNRYTRYLGNGLLRLAYQSHVTQLANQSPKYWRTCTMCQARKNKQPVPCKSGKTRVCHSERGPLHLGPVHTTPEEFENGGFTLKTRQMFFSRPPYAGEIWKRNNTRLFWISVWGILRQGNITIIVTSSFSKSFIFKTFSVHTKTQSRRFQILPVWRAFSKSSVFVTD